MAAELTRALQLRELDILKEIVKIFRRHDLCYFAFGGTALGAVRHGGFIPWDDDMDIGMPRGDYEKFRAVAPTELPAYLKLSDYDNVKCSTRLYLKVQDIRTSCIEDLALTYPELASGVWVDIFPCDGYPSGRRLNGRISALLDINRVLRLPDEAMSTLTDKVALWFYRPLRRFLPYNWASRRLDKLLAGYTLESAPYALSSFFSFFPNCIFPLENRRFEDMELPCPARYDEYMTALYGNYMRLPPEQARNSGHTVIYADLELPLAQWDASRCPPTENTADDGQSELVTKLTSVRGQLERYDYLRANGWKAIIRDCLGKAYVSLWYVMTHDKGDHRDEIEQHFKKLRKAQLRSFRLKEAAMLSLLHWRLRRR